MVERNEIYWADLGPPSGRRPRCVITRDAAREHGLPEPCVVNCDSVPTLPIDVLDDRPIGRLDETSRAALDRAFRYAVDIVY